MFQDTIIETRRISHIQGKVDMASDQVCVLCCASRGIDLVRVEYHSFKSLFKKQL